MKKIREHLSEEAGFTLIELIVVIAVLGILAAVAIPRLTGVTSKAKMTEAVSAMGSIKTALEMEKVENGSYPGTSENTNTFDTVISQYIDGYSGGESGGEWEGWTVNYGSGENGTGDVSGDKFYVVMTKKVDPDDTNSKKMTVTLEHNVVKEGSTKYEYKDVKTEIK